jgi:filamentous hemagglutinin
MIKRPTAQQAAESSAAKQSVAANATARAAAQPEASTLDKVKLPCAEAAENALATGRNQAVFWSGVGKPGVPGYDVAMQWAAKNGGATLESTMAARGIKLPVWDAKNPAVVAAWEKASADFVRGASGHVRVLQADTVGVNSIWGRIEYKSLQSNPNVQSITSVHPETSAEFLLWSR